MCLRAASRAAYQYQTITPSTQCRQLPRTCHSMMDYSIVACPFLQLIPKLRTALLAYAATSHLWRPTSSCYVCGSTGAEWTTFNVPTSWPRRDRCMLYGHNDLQLAKPHFFPIYLQTLSFILFLVQVCLKRPAFSLLL